MSEVHPIISIDLCTQFNVIAALYPRRVSVTGFLPPLNRTLMNAEHIRNIAIMPTLTTARPLWWTVAAQRYLPGEPAIKTREDSMI